MSEYQWYDFIMRLEENYQLRAEFECIPQRKRQCSKLKKI